VVPFSLGSSEQTWDNVKRFRGGLVVKAHKLFVSLSSRLESNQEEEEDLGHGLGGLDFLRENGASDGV